MPPDPRRTDLSQGFVPLFGLAGGVGVINGAKADAPRPVQTMLLLLDPPNSNSPRFGLVQWMPSLAFRATDDRPLSETRPAFFAVTLSSPVTG